jgi:hypothetical protein
MTQHYTQAAPPDDGGGEGSFTTPDQALLEDRGNTESSELLPETPFRDRHSNKGLMVFWLVVLVCASIMAVVAQI